MKTTFIAFCALFLVQTHSIAAEVVMSASQQKVWASPSPTLAK